VSDKTGIAWTDATWNPTTGCSHLSAGCEHCFAETLSLRYGWSKKPWTAPNAAENVVLHPERLDQPLRWTKPRRVFVNSMSDLFHERIEWDYIARVFETMYRTPRHTYQILTKRPEVMRKFVEWFLCHVGEEFVREDDALYHPILPPHIWLGVSIEQDRWCGRADILRDTPAAVRFISAEPLLEPLPALNLTDIDWLIFGGESGHTPDGRSLVERCECPGGATQAARYERRFAQVPCLRCAETGWRPKPWALVEARRLRDLCRGHGAAYFLKQWGGPTPISGGHLLDGIEYHQFPEVQA